MILLCIFRFFAALILVSCFFLSPLSYAAEDDPNEGMTERFYQRGAWLHRMPCKEDARYC